LFTLTFLLLLRIHSYISLVFSPRNFMLVTDLKNPGIIRTLFRQIYKQIHLLTVSVSWLFFFLKDYETMLLKGRNTKEKWKNFILLQGMKSYKVWFFSWFNLNCINLPQLFGHFLHMRCRLLYCKSGSIFSIPLKVL